jgi:hypothetical protein
MHFSGKQIRQRADPKRKGNRLKHVSFLRLERVRRCYVNLESYRYALIPRCSARCIRSVFRHAPAAYTFRFTSCESEVYAWATQLRGVARARATAD